MNRPAWYLAPSHYHTRCLRRHKISPLYYIYSIYIHTWVYVCVSVCVCVCMRTYILSRECAIQIWTPSVLSPLFPHTRVSSPDAIQIYVQYAARIVLPRKNRISAISYTVTHARNQIFKNEFRILSIQFSREWKKIKCLSVARVVRFFFPPPMRTRDDKKYRGRSEISSTDSILGPGISDRLIFPSRRMNREFVTHSDREVPDYVCEIMKANELFKREKLRRKQVFF